MHSTMLFLFFKIIQHLFFAFQVIPARDQTRNIATHDNRKNNVTTYHVTQCIWRSIHAQLLNE